MIHEQCRRKAIRHYNRMIKWAKTQNPKSKVSKKKMEKEIGESWSGRDCAYCTEYIAMWCGGCPLRPCGYATDYPGEVCCSGLYYKMLTTSIWSSWIKAAEKVRDFIKENG